MTEAIPPNIRFGTSSWVYPGWEGLVYKSHYKSQKSFKEDCLAEYAGYPLFTTVGIDHSFYSPPSPRTLSRYAGQVPATFRWVSKVWEDITVPLFPKHPRYGAKAGAKNPLFLDAAAFRSQVFKVYFDDPEVWQRTGPFVFQFGWISPKVVSPDVFFSRLQTFLLALPTEAKYGVEIRNPEFLSKEYFDILNRAGATHVFNHWTGMPGLREQMVKAAEAGGLSSDFYVSRILTPLGVSYEDAVRLFEPYREIQRPNPQMRADVLKLVKRGIDRNVDTFIIVNNRSEGCAPQTIEELAQLIRTELLV